MPLVKHSFFQPNAWLRDTSFFLWLPKPSDLRKATRKFYRKDLSVSNMEMKVLQSHAHVKNPMKKIKKKEENKNFSKKSNF